MHQSGTAQQPEDGGGAAETRELMVQRRAELQEMVGREERRQLQGRWMTDKNALKHRETRRREQNNRRAPKRLAHASLYTAWGSGSPQADTGLEMESHEVADRVTQADLVQAVDLQTQRKKFELVLDGLGPYKIGFTRSGTHLLLAGLRGHLANIRWKNFALEGETQLKDKINDAIFLVDHTMTAVAQKKYVYMYTREGVEMHILSKLAHMDSLGYLPHHMLLVAASSVYSILQYLDVSTGVELGAKAPAVVRDPSSCLAVNPGNGIVATGDVRGVVKLWSPAVVDALVQLKAHRGVIEAMAFHPNGRFFATLGGDRHLKLWDCRTLRALEEYVVGTECHSLDISSKGLVALGAGTQVQVWRGMFTAQKPSAPFLRFALGYGTVAHALRFCPFEDVLGVGHSRGFTSLLVPGSGEANPDFFYANPHETERHRRERVVTGLLDKLPPDTIAMDVQVAGVNEARLTEYMENVRLSRRARSIREKKQRRADCPLPGVAAAAPTGLGALAEDVAEEVDEDLGYKERPATRQLKSRQEKLRQRKMQRWDKKDSADKVRSKQTLRQSRLVQRVRARRTQDELHGSYDKDALNPEEAMALKAVAEARAREKKSRRRAAEDTADDVRFLMHRDRGAAGRRQEEGKGAGGAELAANAALRRLLTRG